MRNKPLFKSVLAKFMTEFLNEKRAMGYNYDTEEKILIRFDKYCSDKQLNTVCYNREFISDWCRQSETENSSNHNKRVSAVRQLTKYLISIGINAYYPNEIIKVEQVLPHLFTERERLEFFNVLDSYKYENPASVHFRLLNEYKVFFRLLYCCGLRNGEACRLKSEDVSLSEGILKICNSKGQKDRLVYMHKDLTELCSNYYSYICKTLGCMPEWFFPARKADRHLITTSMDRVFNNIWTRTDSSKNCNNKPTAHDFRFSFVTERINRWAEERVDIDAMMPYLSRYLGHKNIEETYYYYHTSEELFKNIKRGDKTGADLIPEVEDYEE